MVRVLCSSRVSIPFSNVIAKKGFVHVGLGVLVNFCKVDLEVVFEVFVEILTQ